MQNTNEPAGFNPARPKEIGPDYGRGGFQAGQGSASQNLSDQAMAAGRDMAARAREAASSTADAVKTQAADLASEGRDKLMEKAQDQKRAGADYISGLAEAIRRAAGEIDNEVPFAANYIRSAASEVDNVAETVRNGDFSALMTQTQDFARRQPTLFVGLSMLAGFGVARLLKGAATPMITGSAQSGSAQSLSAFAGHTGSGTNASRTLSGGAGGARQQTTSGVEPSKDLGLGM